MYRTNNNLVKQPQAPQTLEILDERTNGWIKVDTQLGEKWIAPNGVEVELSFATRIYNEADLLKSTSAFIEQQTITVYEQTMVGGELIHGQEKDGLHLMVSKKI